MITILVGGLGVTTQLSFGLSFKPTYTHFSDSCGLPNFYSGFIAIHMLKSSNKFRRKYPFMFY